MKTKTSKNKDLRTFAIVAIAAVALIFILKNLLIVAVVLAVVIGLLIVLCFTNAKVKAWFNAKFNKLLRRNGKNGLQTKDAADKATSGKKVGKIV